MADPALTPPPKDFKGSGRGGMPIPGEIPGGPKPIVWKGMVLNSKLVFFYSFLFVVPSAVTYWLYTGGKTQATREEIINSDSYKARMREKYGEESEERVKEMKAQMNKVLFETRGTLRTEWAIKRDEERKRKAEEAAAAKAAAA